jgi:hypothetical protein
VVTHRFDELFLLKVGLDCARPNCKCINLDEKLSEVTLLKRLLIAAIETILADNRVRDYSCMLIFLICIRDFASLSCSGNPFCEARNKKIGTDSPTVLLPVKAGKRKRHNH